MSSLRMNINGNSIQLFSTLGCKYCRIVKTKLQEFNLIYSEFDINKDYNEQLSNELRERLEHARSNTVPQIYIGSEHIGGCDDLIRSIENGDFEKKLKNRNINYINYGLSWNNDKSRPMTPNGGENVFRRLILQRWEPINSPRIQKAFEEVCINNENQSLDSIIISKRLQSLALKLTDEYSSSDGRRIDYDKAGCSPIMTDMIQLFCRLASRDVELELLRLDDMGRKAFFCNLYNAMVIVGLCVLHSDRTNYMNFLSANKPILELYNGEFIRIIIGDCGEYFSLDDIEHGILRGNRAHPSEQNEDSTLKYFRDEDHRARFALTRTDARVHFALNCGAASCPAIRIYTSENIERALSIATAHYLLDEVYVSEGEVHLPRLMLWYKDDFGKDLLGRLRFVENALLSAEQEFDSRAAERARVLRTSLKLIVNSFQSGDSSEEFFYAMFRDSDTTQMKFRVIYNAYDWSINNTERQVHDL